MSFRPLVGRPTPCVLDECCSGGLAPVIDIPDQQTFVNCSRVSRACFINHQTRKWFRTLSHEHATALFGCALKVVWEGPGDHISRPRLPGLGSLRMTWLSLTLSLPLPRLLPDSNRNAHRPSGAQQWPWCSATKVEKAPNDQPRCCWTIHPSVCTRPKHHTSGCPRCRVMTGRV